MITKEERHKFFSGKRILVTSKQEQVLLQAVLFASGFEWHSTGNNFLALDANSSIIYFIGVCSANIITWGTGTRASADCSIFDVEVFKHLILTKEELVTVLLTQRILVKNEEESRQLQEFFFTLGYGWESKTSKNFNKVDHLKHPILVLKDKRILFSDNAANYDLEFIHLKKLIELFSRPENSISLTAKQSAIEYFKDKSIYLTSSEQSKILQKSLFKLGWKWRYNGQHVSYFDTSVITANSDMILTYKGDRSGNCIDFEDIPKEYLIQEEMKEETKFPELKPGMVVELINGDIGFVLLRDNEQSCYIACVNWCLANNEETHANIAKVGVFKVMFPRRTDNSTLQRSKAINWIWEKSESKDTDKVTVQAPASKEPAKIKFKEQIIVQTTFKKFF